MAPSWGCRGYGRCASAGCCTCGPRVGGAANRLGRRASALPRLRRPPGAETESRGVVYGDVRLLRGRKGVAMKSDSTAAGYLGFDLITAKLRSVVADLVDLIRTRRFDVAGIERTSDRSDEYVT